MNVHNPHGGGLSPLRHSSVKDLRGNDIHVLPLDFETYFDKEVTLKKMPTTLYIRHPKFKVHGCGVYWEGKYQWMTEDNLYDFFLALPWEQIAVLAHNCPFDGFILSEYFGFTPAYYLDSAAMSRGLRGTNACHTLNCLADSFGFGQKIENTLDSTEGLEELPPYHLEALGEYCLQDVNLMIQSFDKMMDMGYPEKERHIISLTTKAFADPKLMVDPQLCIEEIEAEQQATSELLKTVGVPASQLSSSSKFADLLRARGVEPPTKENPKGQTIYAFSKQDESFLALERDPRVSTLVQARRRVKSRIGETRAHSLMAQGRPTLPVPLMYCGAHTHRWTASGGINLQNLPAGRKGQSERLRNSIKAPPGWKLIQSDSSQIEARVAARMAEQWDLLAAFAGEGDPYIDQAEETFGHKVGKKDPERSVGKQGMLSFQYGVGWRKYLTSVRVGTQGPPYELEEDQAIRAVQAYRSKYTAITSTWRTLDQALDRMTVPGCNWEPIPYVRFEHRRVRMPNKLRIYYPGLDGIDYGDGRLQYEYQSRHGTNKIYGGAFFENLVQSVARTIVAEQALEIAKRYPDVVLLVHDEVLFLAPEEEAEDALQFSLDCLSTPPQWCEDLSLGAEGYISDFYKK